ncbi:HAD family hydrolase [Sphingobium sp. R-21]|uniref:HAD family hydrolase n=1 Tax=Sphingobium sp. R-21 TaxID=3404056 RepID=UPI003CEFAFBC
MTKKFLLICDFDNTLYDWVSYFVSSFYKMVDEALVILGCDREYLLDDLRDIHRRYSDSEHPFALLETEAVKASFPDLSRQQQAEALDRAFHAFNKTRKETLTLYPGVAETLSFFQRNGVRIVGHTEAKYLAVTDRLRRLDLSQYFERIYCRERSTSSHPDQYAADNPSDDIEIVELAHHQSKPSAEVLLEICEREGYSPQNSVYVGDSLIKDILMANRAGVRSVWAKYGLKTSAGAYEQLVRVSHWKDEDIKREQAIRKSIGTIVPNVTLENSFSELKTFLNDH